jgi:2-polyprenyl-6-hydroxyphenyl methylase / 3-demethylubiquinone-9 3-methyltransferase
MEVNHLIDAKTRHTKAFYDSYWPANVPDYTRTREHVRQIVPPGHYKRALDGGCGTGVCSLALAEMSDEVVAFDLSSGSLATAQRLAQTVGAKNIQFKQGSLLDIPVPSNNFDLVFSWGVIHHTVNPVRALDELVRVLQPGGTLVLAVYLKTPLTFVHEAIRFVCLRIPRSKRKPIIRAFTRLTRLGEKLGHNTNVRDDNPLIESQVEDWYFVPEKHFFTIEEMRRLFKERGLTYEVVCEQTGRFKSSSNFIIRGIRRSESEERTNGS